jgi:hypothetical protein
MAYCSILTDCRHCNAVTKPPVKPPAQPAGDQENETPTAEPFHSGPSLYKR